MNVWNERKQQKGHEGEGCVEFGKGAVDGGLEAIKRTYVQG